MGSNDAKVARWPLILVALVVLGFIARLLVSRSQATANRTDDVTGNTDRAREGVGANGSVGTPAPPTANRVDGEPANATPVDHTVRDAALHERVRAQILAAWSQAHTHNAAGSNLPPPDDASAPGTLEPTYIRSLIHDEFLPMARTCYDQQVERAQEAHGRIVMSFVVIADEHAGGVVDDVQIDGGDAGVFDETFRTCMRETMRTMTFRAPSGGGRVTVRYPFALESARDE